MGSGRCVGSGSMPRGPPRRGRLVLPATPKDRNGPRGYRPATRSEEHTSELQSRSDLVCRLLLEKKKQIDPARSHKWDLIPEPIPLEQHEEHFFTQHPREVAQGVWFQAYTRIAGEHR